MTLPRRISTAPIRPDRWSALRFASLRWAALPVIDRRWTVPLSGIALAFGVFVGIAIGPGTEGSLGSQPQTVVEVVRPPVTDQPAGGDGGGPNQGGRGGNGGPNAAAPPPASPPEDVGPFDPPDTTPDPPASPPSTTTPTTTTTTPTTTTPEDTDDDEDEEPTPVPTLVKGAVVHVNEFANSYTVAREDGTLTAIHASNLPSLGAVIKVDTRTLANGTRAENGKRDRTDRTESVDVSGTVTFSDPRIGAYTVSAPGTSVLVRAPAGARMAPVGSTVITRVRIADKLDPIEAQQAGREGCGSAPPLPKPRKYALEQTNLSITGNAKSSGLEGVVQGVCRKSGSLILSADAVRESGRDITVIVPSSLSLAALKPGQVLKIRAAIGKAGNLTAATIADDEGESAADDSGRIQR